MNSTIEFQGSLPRVRCSACNKPLDEYADAIADDSDGPSTDDPYPTKTDLERQQIEAEQGIEAEKGIIGGFAVH